MFKTSNFTNAEAISLAKEIYKVGDANDTPLLSLLLSKGLTGKASSTVHTWRERSYNSTDIGNGAVEGNENISMYESGRAELNNILQIFERGASVSGSAMAMQNTTLSNEIADRLVEVKQGLEMALTSGVRDDGSTSPYIRKMDGIEHWAHTNNVISGATIGTITEDEIKATLKTLWTQGLASSQYFALVNADIKEMIDEIYKNSYSYLHQTNVFGLIVDGIRTNYGTVYFLLSRYASDDKMTVFDPNFLSVDFLRQPQFEPLAKVGDSVRGMVVAEATLKVGSKKAVAQYNLKTA